MHMTSGTVKWIFSLLFITQNSFCQSELPPPCDSEIFCHGPLLHTVQMAHLHNDSKHFVDMTLKNSPAETLRAFSLFMNETNNKPDQDQVQDFVDKHFQEPQSEFVEWIPDDWVEKPAFLEKVADEKFKDWGYKLNVMWKSLGRKISEDVMKAPDRYSQIYVKNPVIVPGGRFREFYYWDSYWTMEGLLLSGMSHTVKGMLENFIEMVNTYGFVPNGGRIYYTQRSQPPYLISMFKLYHDYTNDTAFIVKNLNALEKEYNFWEKNRTIAVRDKRDKVRKVIQYHSKSDHPRPESYREDYELAEKEAGTRDKTRMYVELKSGAESGWDYSTRWFFNSEQIGSLADINVTAIAPVDLNSLMCRNAKILSEFFLMAHKRGRSEEYDQVAKEKEQLMTDLFWDDKEGIWYDLNVNTGEKRKTFYLSNIHPLWSGCYGMGGEEDKKEVAEKVIQHLEKSKIFEFEGGVPTTKQRSGEQWDYPNAWAPLQHHIIMGLKQHTDIPKAQDYAFQLAEKWIRNNWNAYIDTSLMYEKYDATRIGIPGGGGEYEIVVGFGWTNGVAMKLLDEFGDKLTAALPSSANRLVKTSPIVYFIWFLTSYLFFYRI